MIFAFLATVGLSLLAAAAVCWLADNAGVNRVLDLIFPIDDPDAFNGNGWLPYTPPEDERSRTT